jgi:hypothetical protein
MDTGLWMPEMCTSFCSTNGSPSTSTILCGRGHNKCRPLWITSSLTGVLMCVRIRFSIAYSHKAVVDISPLTQRWNFLIQCTETTNSTVSDSTFQTSHLANCTLDWANKIIPRHSKNTYLNSRKRLFMIMQCCISTAD